MQSISAAVHIQGPAIRYAEVGRDGSSVTFRRLEVETFDVDVTRVLWGDERADALDAIVDGVERLLADSEASTVGLVVHPLDAYSFFMPLPGELSTEEREQRAAYQAALVTNSRSPGALHTVSQSVRTGSEGDETVEWVHVLAVPQEVERRTRSLFAGVSGVETTGRIVSSEAAAELMTHSQLPGEGASDGTEGFWLAVGQYGGHTEYALTYDGKWYHAHAAENAPTGDDQAYYGVGMLNRIGLTPDEIDRLFVYGPGAHEAVPDPFESVFGGTPLQLDPYEQLGWNAEQPEGASAEDVPCIGGALAVSEE